MRGENRIWAGWSADDYGRSRDTGKREWENNFAIIFEHRPGETPIDAPEIDLN
jgi:hypothetical protein